MLQLLQQIILLIGVEFGALTDAKTGYIYDFITYPMIAFGLILSLIQLQFFNLISAGAIFVLLFILYKFGKIGGGDVKLFTAIALLNPFNQINFLMTLGFVAAMSSMVFYSIYYLIKYARLGINIQQEKKGILNALIMGLVLIIYFAFMLENNYISIYFVYLFGVPFLFGLIFMALQDGIKKEFFEEKISINKIEEDEILGSKNNKKIIKLFLNKPLINPGDISILKKNKIKEIYVLRNLPKFGPFIFIGTIIALIMPNLIQYLFL